MKTNLDALADVRKALAGLPAASRVYVLSLVMRDVSEGLQLVSGEPSTPHLPVALLTKSATSPKKRKAARRRPNPKMVGSNVFQFLEDFIAKNNRPPLYREIAKGLSISFSHVAQTLRSLEKQGRIKRGGYGHPSLLTIVRPSTVPSEPSPRSE